MPAFFVDRDANLTDTWGYAMAGIGMRSARSRLPLPLLAALLARLVDNGTEALNASEQALLRQVPDLLEGEAAAAGITRNYLGGSDDYPTAGGEFRYVVRATERTLGLSDRWARNLASCSNDQCRLRTLGQMFVRASEGDHAAAEDVLAVLERANSLLAESYMR